MRTSAFYRPRPVLRFVDATTREVFGPLTCYVCGCTDQDKFEIVRIPGGKPYAVECRGCGERGPETCHATPLIAYSRWATRFDELKEAADKKAGLIPTQGTT